MHSTSTAAALSSKDGYSVWAQTYDTAPNPMLSLEHRILESILPDARELDVVDLGCGTGRWLAALRNAGARSLLGIDSCPEMLQVAKSKLGGNSVLLNADCTQLSLPPASADLVLCSFLLSYIEDASSFLEKVGAILRPNGRAFLTDLHPDTSTRLNWRRGVHRDDGFQEIQTFHRTFQELIQICETSNLDIEVCLQPRFGAPERLILQAAGKREYFEHSKDHPAIYVLQLRPRQTTRDLPGNCSVSFLREGTASAVPKNSGIAGVLTPEVSAHTITTIKRARLAFGANSSALADLECVDSRIASIRDHATSTPATPRDEAAINLSGFLVFPGLVNSHDHLEFALFPRLGRSNYKNFLEWADDIHRPDSSPVFEHRQVPREVRLWWGGIRNLLSGVTTVCHHNPYESSVFEDDFILRVVRDYGWAHSLPMDSEIAPKKQSTPKGHPFLIHLAEGIDERSAQEIFQLHQSGALDEDTVLIHGLALDHEGKKLLHSTRSGLIWCPSSNIFLFGQTHSSSDVQEFPRVALGSDSPLTAQGDLLDELRFAHEFIGAPAENLHSYVTQGAANLLRLKNGEGTLRIGAWADLIAVRDTGATPAESLATLSHVDVELVLLGGSVQLASAEIIKRLPPSVTMGLQPLCVEGTVRWIRAPLRWLFAETTPHLGDEIRLGGKRVSFAN
jgi:cytosine/adenosine deaminase-related metal-dependent hydrolase/ubiquinone/menaquinone biosynthesis C-methylase UbiE